MANKVDSLQTVLASLDPSSRLEAMVLHQEIGAECFRQFDYANALTHYKQGLTLARELADETAQYDFLNLSGRTYFWMDNYPAAMDFYRQAKKLEEDYAISPRLQINNLSWIAEVYISMGNYPLALEYQLQALQIAERQEDQPSIASAYDNIGNIYFRQGRMEEARKNLELALPIYRSTQRQVNVYNTLAALTSVRAETGDYARAKIAARESLEIAETIGYTYGIAFSTGMLGVVAQKEGKGAAAVTFLSEAIQRFREDGVAYEAADFGLQLAKLYNQRGQLAEAQTQLDSILKVALAIQARPLLSEAYSLLARNAAQLKQYQAAYDYLSLHAEQQDSLLNQEIIRQTTNLERDYAIQRQKRANQELKAESEAARNRIILIGSLLGLALLLLLASTLYFRYRSQEKSAMLLSKKNEEIAVQNDKLANSNAELRQMTDLAANDLKTPLQKMQSILYHLQSHPLEFEDRLSEFQNELDQLDDLLAGISIYSVVGENDDERVSVDLREVVGTAMSQLPKELPLQMAKIEVDNLPVVQAYQRQITQLFTHLLTNALKFRKPGTTAQVRISGKAYPDYDLITVEDKGQGIPEEAQSEVFRLFYRLERDESITGTGIGLAIAKKVVEQHEGKIWLSSENGEGCTVSFTLPR
ncbi:MAG: tetratricopeptide repeat protein [Bacteroidota bacterium]